MKLLHSIDKFLENLSVIKFIIIITTGMVFCSFGLGLVASVFPKTGAMSVRPNIMKETLILQFVISLIVAPLIETFLFQMCVINGLRKINIIKRNNLIIVIISALIFGIQHFYNVDYIINTTVAGLFLSYAYITYEKKKVSSFCVVCIIHSLRNLIALIVNCIL